MILVPRIAAQIAVAFCLAFGPLACPQDRCGFSERDNGLKLEKSLHKAKSCKAAADLFHECRWGSSADVGFGAIAIKKCKQESEGKLTRAQQKNLTAQIDLCTYEYARQSGTLYISETVACHLDVVAAFAADPQKATVPIPSASFDCKAAKSPLEKAICSDAALGRADVVLGRVYADDLKYAKGPDKLALIEAEKKWLRTLPAKCTLTASPPAKTIACLRNEFELRFSRLDGCANDMESCLSGDAFDPVGQSQ